MNNKIKATAILGFFGEYRWLSNFWTTPITYEGITYPSSEHLYQAFKTKNNILRKQIANVPIKNVKSYCRTIKLRDGWDTEPKNLRVRAMWKATTLKYKDQKLKIKLLDTAGCELEEVNNWGDTFWGTTISKSGDRIGENMLGQILMAYRDFSLGITNTEVSPQVQNLVSLKLEK